MNLKNLLIIIIVAILIKIIFELHRFNVLKTCPKPYTEYRYVPRTFKEQQDNPVPLEDIFDSMFAKPSPWMMSQGIGARDRLDTKLKGRYLNFI